MSEIQQNRYDQLLRRVADLKGPGSKVNDALGELFPMIDVENVPAELLILYGSRVCLGGADLSAGGAGFFNQGMLRNPGESGVIITILDLLLSSNATQGFVYGPTLNTLANSQPTAFTDTRVFGQGTVGQVLTEALLVAGPTFGRLRLSSNNPVHLHVPRAMAVLSPGTAFSIGCAPANTTLTFSFTWIERVAQPSEFNL